MSVDICFDRLVLEFAGPDEKRYFALFEEVGCNNLRDYRSNRIARSWHFLFFGTYRHCMANVARFSTQCEGRCLQHGSPGGNGFWSVTPEGYITAWERAIHDAFVLTDATVLPATIEAPRDRDQDDHGKITRYQAAAQCNQRAGGGSFELYDELTGDLSYNLCDPQSAQRYAQTLEGVDYTPWREVCPTAKLMDREIRCGDVVTGSDESVSTLFVKKFNDLCEPWWRVAGADDLINTTSRTSQSYYQWFGDAVKAGLPLVVQGADPKNIIRAIRRAYANLPQADQLVVKVERRNAHYGEISFPMTTGLVNDNDLVQIEVSVEQWERRFRWVGASVSVPFPTCAGAASKSPPAPPTSC